MTFITQNNSATDIHSHPFNLLQGRDPSDVYVPEYQVPDTNVVLSAHQVWETYAQFLNYSGDTNGGLALDAYEDFFAPKILGSRIDKAAVSTLAGELRQRIKPLSETVTIRDMHALQNKIIPQRQLHYMALTDEAFALAVKNESISLLEMHGTYYIVQGYHKITAAAERQQKRLPCQVFHIAQFSEAEQDAMEPRVKLEAHDFIRSAKRYGGEGRHVDFIKVYRNQFSWDMPHFLKTFLIPE